MRSAGDTVGSRFDGGPNALNFLRLLLALEVVAWHSYALRGGTWLPVQLERVMGEIGVDAFFAISGFLICRAWFRRRSTSAYLVARARRILPGLWVCLLVTALVIAPAASALAGGPQPTLSGSVRYVLANADTWATQWAIDGTPFGVRDIGWNGSLWTLGYEVVCYLVLAALGLARLLRPTVVAALAGSFWVLSLVITVGSPTDLDWQVLVAPRLGLMFALGALLWMHRDRIPFSRALCAASVACLVAGAFTPNYRLIAAPAVVYLCLVVGIALARWPRLVLRNDLSYGTYIYAFPIQQALLVNGIVLGWVGFVTLSVACVLPVAALSWFLIERPALPRGRTTGPVVGDPYRDRRPAGTLAP